MYEESIDYHKNKMDFDNGLNMEKICHKCHMFCFALEKSALQNIFIDTMKILPIYLHLVLKLLYFFVICYLISNSVIVWSGNLVFS